MTLDQQIAVNERLLEREALFSHVYEIEQAINASLGAPYPLPPPPDIPSRRATRPSKKRAAGTTPKPPPPKVRPLYDDEIGFRITYPTPDHDGGETSEDHTDAKLVGHWLRGDSGLPKPTRVETIGDDGGVCEQLWPLKD
jgi:hypothetical protein